MCYEVTPEIFGEKAPECCIFLVMTHRQKFKFKKSYNKISF